MPHTDNYKNALEKSKGLKKESLPEDTQTSIIRFTDIKEAKEYLKGQKLSAFATNEITDNSILEIANILYSNKK
ncbi:MAG: hypothetical protein J6A92_08250 [Lachnospiraceae bacterium]|nr:hypothetical protein [Lachnospiraceae bacterium]